MNQLEVFQFGGGEGSYAGDCCLMVATVGAVKHHFVIDLGMSNQMTRLGTKLGVLSRVSSTLLLTHFHKDHVGGENSMLPQSIKTSGWKAYHSRTLPDVKAGHDITKGTTKTWFTNYTGEHAVPSNGDTLWTVKFSHYTLTLRVIVPDFSKVKTRNKLDENECSLGALIQVVKDSDDSPIFSFLSLGDMTPKNDDVLEAVLDRANWPQIDLLKFAHHGSDNNYLETVAQILNQGRTDVLISGFTSGESKSWRRLKNDGARAVTFLVDTEKASNLVSLASFKNLAGPKFRAWRDATVTVDLEAETVQMKGMPWNLDNSKYPPVAKAGTEAVVDLFPLPPEEAAPEDEEDEEDVPAPRESTKRSRNTPEESDSGSDEESDSGSDEEEEEEPVRVVEKKRQRTQPPPVSPFLPSSSTPTFTIGASTSTGGNKRQRRKFVSRPTEYPLRSRNK